MILQCKAIFSWRTWSNEMNYGMNHAPDARLITQPTDRVMDPAPGAWFIPKFMPKPKVVFSPVQPHSAPLWPNKPFIHCYHICLSYEQIGSGHSPWFGNGQQCYIYNCFISMYLVLPCVVWLCELAVQFTGTEYRIQPNKQWVSGCTTGNIYEHNFSTFTFYRTKFPIPLFSRFLRCILMEKITVDQYAIYLLPQTNAKVTKLILNIPIITTKIVRHFPQNLW